MDKNKALKLLNPVLGLLLVLSSLLHLALNWPWVKAAYSGPGGRE